MSNCDVFTLPTLEVEPHQVREVLRCLLHTIIFNRALGYVTPRDVDSELFDITYVHCGDEEVDAKLEQKITEFYSFVDRRPSDIAQLRLSFYHPVKRQVSWFGKEERMVWEQWVVNVALTPRDCFMRPASAPTSTVTRTARQQQQQAGLERAMSTVLRYVGSNPEHMPPASSTGILSFPFHISISGGTSRSSSFNLSSMKRMLLSANPPSVLG